MRLKKKVLVSLTISVLLVSALSVTALAGGRHSGSYTGQAESYAVCPKTSCTRTGTHTHSGTRYAAHQSQDGHSYHGNAGQGGGNHGRHAGEAHH